MAEPATVSGGKYLVFYYDAERRVELAARIPEKKAKTQDGYPVKLQIRAKILDDKGRPHIAHYQMYTKKGERKKFRFERNDPTELVEVRVFIDEKTGKEKTTERVFESGTLRQTALDEKREMGLVYERPIREGPKLAMHGSKPRKSMIAGSEFDDRLRQTLDTIKTFPVGLRNTVIGRTCKALETRQNRQDKTIDKIKHEQSEQKPLSKKEKQRARHHQHEQLAKAVEDHIPKVYVRTADGKIERLFFEVYQQEFAKRNRHANNRTPKPRMGGDEPDLDATAIAEMKFGRIGKPPTPIAPYTDPDDALSINPLPPPPKIDASIHAQDALYVLVKNMQGNIVKTEAPHLTLSLSQKRMRERGLSPKQRTNYDTAIKSGYEVWILKKEPTPQTPHFFVIKRNSKHTIESAARFTFSRHDDDAATLFAELWPYNEEKPLSAPLTHPTHNMYTHHTPPPLTTAQTIANLFANDALAAWHEHYANIPQDNNLLGKKPDTLISEATHKGPALTDVIPITKPRLVFSR